MDAESSSSVIVYMQFCGDLDAQKRKKKKEKSDNGEITCSK